MTWTIWIAAGLLLLLFFVTQLDGMKSLNIKAKTVGDGQHGTARWATNAEINKAYERVLYRPKEWREGKNLPTAPGFIVGTRGSEGKYTALVDKGMVHALVEASPDAGKTAHILYPNLEYVMACGASFITLDTKGDLYRNMGAVGEKYYGYQTAVYDLRKPMQSDYYNLMQLVNRYTDRYKETRDVQYQARAEKYAKIISKSIVMSADTDYGVNSYFYDAAEGLITAAILVVSEYGEREARHIVSVIKLLQAAQRTKKGEKSPVAKLLDKLPENHKAKWFASSALTSADQSAASVVSTALSRLNAFLDSEMEQMLCFDSKITMEEFVEKPTAIYIVLPEEDETKYFAVSLMIQQMNRELISLADEMGGKLPKKVLCFYDELGTVPKIQGLVQMFAAIRSRNVSLMGILQGESQIAEKYGDKPAETIKDCCQVVIAGGFGPLAKTAEIISDALETKTVTSGSVSTNKDGSSRTLQMIERPLMTAGELRRLPRGHFVVMKTGVRPMIGHFPLFLKWGISFSEEAYTVPCKEVMPVKYTDLFKLEKSIVWENGVSYESEGVPPMNTRKKEFQRVTVRE